jgi:hypothetical protein
MKSNVVVSRWIASAGHALPLYFVVSVLKYIMLFFIGLSRCY